MLTAHNISKSYANHRIFSNLSFVIGNREKIALIGQNGVGKSTLLKILAGCEESDSGSITRGTSLVGYLPQEINISFQETVAHYLKRVTGISVIEEEMALLEGSLTDPSLLEHYGDLQSEYSRLNGYAFDHRIRIFLKGFNLDECAPDRLLTALSGGEKSKIALIGILLCVPDILLLDEPTNNIDLPAIIWLEMYLKSINASCLIVSHDRLFLDAIATKVIEIEWYERTLCEYKGSYSDYCANKEKRMRREQELYAIQQKELQRMKESAINAQDWAQQGSRQTTSDNDKYIRGAQRDRSSGLARRAKTIQKHIEKTDVVKITRERPQLIIPFAPRNDEAKHEIHLDNVAVSYPKGFHLSHLTIHIPYGSRVGIIGKNGSGKSTILKVIAGELQPSSGTLSIGPSLIIGNMMQAHENMPRSKTVMEFFEGCGVVDRQQAFSTLSKFHISADDAISKRILTLSPGERARVLLALYSVLEVNVLLLDEPTNHLDMEAVEALEHALITYTGIIIFVSHDRSFLEHIHPTFLYMLSDGRLTLIDDYESYVHSVTVEAQRLLSLLPAQ